MLETETGIFRLGRLLFRPPLLFVFALIAPGGGCALFTDPYNFPEELVRPHGDARVALPELPDEQEKSDITTSRDFTAGGPAANNGGSERCALFNGHVCVWTTSAVLHLWIFRIIFVS